MTTSTTVGFAIYFSLWHSLKHIEEVYNLNNYLSIKQSLINFFKDALPFSFISFLGLAVLYTGFTYLEFNQSLLSISLILVSALTLPHVVIVAQLYEKA